MKNVGFSAAPNIHRAQIISRFNAAGNLYDAIRCQPGLPTEAQLKRINALTSQAAKLILDASKQNVIQFGLTLGCDVRQVLENDETIVYAPSALKDDIVETRVDFPTGTIKEITPYINIVNMPLLHIVTGSGQCVVTIPESTINLPA